MSPRILFKYKTKRDFKKTSEPAAKVKKKPSKKHLFVIHKHQASHLHYDLRLEMQGVLKSWAVPKGPSLNPTEKRLAIQVEDHPFDYRSFEGIIPPGNYGAGTVMLWDQGLYALASSETKEAAFLKGWREGRLDLIFLGEKIKGAFSLVRIGDAGEKSHWLLIKKKDAFASKKNVSLLDRSVDTGRSMKEITLGHKSKRVL